MSYSFCSILRYLQSNRIEFSKSSDFRKSFLPSFENVAATSAAGQGRDPLRRRPPRAEVAGVVPRGEEAPEPPRRPLLLRRLEAPEGRDHLFFLPALNRLHLIWFVFVSVFLLGLSERKRLYFTKLLNKPMELSRFEDQY